MWRNCRGSERATTCLAIKTIEAGLDGEAIDLRSPPKGPRSNVSDVLCGDQGDVAEVQRIFAKRVASIAGGPAVVLDSDDDHTPPPRQKTLRVDSLDFSQK